MNLKSDFLLNPAYRHLNHGSFGACPRPIFEDYQYWQLRLEQDPVQFFVHDGNKQLEISKAALAEYIHCDPDDLVMTMNPSYAINIIAKTFGLEPGDEILTTNHEYGAMDRTWNYYCNKVGANYVQQDIPLGIQTKEEFIDAFWAGYSHRTKAIFISQITSMTATIFPVTEICERAKELGLITIVDGAHVPGHIPLDLSNLKADIYTGACHKWMMAPKGCSFLYVTKEFQNNFDPLIISWGFEADIPGKSKFLDYHQLQGTRDYSAFLTLPKAIEYMKQNDWWSVSAGCKELILNNYQDLCDIAGTQPITALNSDFLGQMCSVPIPIDDPLELKNLLYDTYKIEIPVFKWRDQIFLRLSAQAYVDQSDVDFLKTALNESKSIIKSWKST